MAGAQSPTVKIVRTITVVRANTFTFGPLLLKYGQILSLFLAGKLASGEAHVESARVQGLARVGVGCDRGRLVVGRREGCERGQSGSGRGDRPGHRVRCPESSLVSRISHQDDDGLCRLE